MLSYKSKRFSELNLNELYAILKLRQEVFIVEQNCPYLDLDDKDQAGIHVLGYDNDGVLHAYARVLDKTVSYPNHASIGRVITSAAYRGKGEGARVMQSSLDIAQKMSWTPLKLSAQVYAIPFYEKLGFSIVGEEYLEDNIPHISMIKV